jgi:hypothetical protein
VFRSPGEVHVANAVDAREVLERAAQQRNVPALVQAVTAVLDASDRSADSVMAERLGASRDYTAGFDAGVQYAADLAVAALRQQPPRIQAPAGERAEGA